MHTVAIPSARRTKAEPEEPGATVRQYQSPGVSLTLIDDRPDDEGFGHADSDVILLRQATRWLELHPGLELTGVHAGFDALGRRQLTITAFGDAEQGPEGAAIRMLHPQDGTRD